MILLTILFAVYGFIVLFILISFFTLKQIKRDKKLNLSIVIPVRNEENLPLLLADLLPEVQKGDEIIVVNDHSQYPVEVPEGVKLINLSISFGKKQALFEGVRAAKNQMILSLDGDVRIGKSYISYLKNNLPTNVQAVVLPIKLKGKGLFNTLSNLEVIALNTIGIGLSNKNIALLANGANFVFQKEHFLSVFDQHQHISGGDEMFTLLSANKISGLFPSFTIPVANNDLTFEQLFTQRIRWAGKTQQLPFTVGKVLGYFLTIVKLSIPLLLVLNYGWWEETTLHYLFLLYGAIDFLFLFLVCFRYREVKSIPLIPVMVVFYPLYLWLVMVGVLFIQPTWKGRKVKHA